MSDSKSPPVVSVPPNRAETSEQPSVTRERQRSTPEQVPLSAPSAQSGPGLPLAISATTPAYVNATPGAKLASDASFEPHAAGDEDSHPDQQTLHLEDDPLINVVLHDTYRIARVIGEGGMGRVYEAWHTRITKKRYAIKVLHPEYARNIGILKRFQREAETAACLSHPNAVGVYDVDVVSVGQERPYLVSEYLEGVDLSQWIKQKAPLDPGFVKHLALQMCDALIEAHGRGVVHRDLKPQNIFLLTDAEGLVPARPVAKVLDFGLSRFVDDADSELTRSGMVMGTPSYMSPEQARGERADHRVDVYGLGAVMFASVTGRPPYKSSSPQATVLAVMNEEAPRPSKLNPSVSPDLELIIQKAMARDANRRYSTMQELRDELDALNIDQGGARANRPKLDSLLLSKRQESPSLRLQLSLFWALGLIAGAGATVAAVWGAVLLQFEQWPLSRNATIWLGLVFIAGFAAPVFGGVRRIRRNVWSNTANVAHALQSARQLTLVALATYGFSALLLLIGNLSGLLFHRSLQLSPTALGTFPGIALVCFITALCFTTAMAWREYLQAPGGWIDSAQTSSRAWVRRFTAGPLLVGAAAGLSLLTVLAAARFATKAPLDAPVSAAVLQGEVSDASKDAVSDAPKGAVLTPPLAEPVLDVDGAGRAFGASVPDAGVKQEREPRANLANSAALSVALSAGTEALHELLAQHPNDPSVLRAVAFDHASTSTGLKAAVAAFGRLFRDSPAAVTDDDVQQIVLSIARGRSNAKRSAFELMANDMGHVGPDMLYRLSLAESTRPQALAYLARPSVRKRFSPALSVAYDLRFSSSCARRLGLLPRATQFGDRRAVRLLHSLSASTKTGCGARKAKPCPSKCPNEEREFIAALEAIKTRLRTTSSGATDGSLN